MLQTGKPGHTLRHTWQHIAPNASWGSSLFHLTFPCPVPPGKGPPMGPMPGGNPGMPPMPPMPGGNPGMPGFFWASSDDESDDESEELDEELSELESDDSSFFVRFLRRLSSFLAPSQGEREARLGETGNKYLSQPGHCFQGRWEEGGYTCVGMVFSVFKTVCLLEIGPPLATVCVSESLL